METSKISKVIQSFDNLPLDEKEYAVRIFKKSITESKRELLTLRVAEANTNYSSGNVKKGNLKDLFKDLENE